MSSYFERSKEKVEYQVTTYEDGKECWYCDGDIHRESGPAITKADGTKEYWLRGRKFANKEGWEKTLNGESLIGKTIEIDGIEYALNFVHRNYEEEVEKIKPDFICTSYLRKL